MAEARECSGTKEHGCLQTSAENCARSCHNRSSMFVFASSSGRCHGGKCECFCETSASANGTCNQTENSATDLYKFEVEPTATTLPKTSSSPGIGKMCMLICRVLISLGSFSPISLDLKPIRFLIVR